MRGRKLRIKWEEESDFLRNLYREEQDEEIRRRLQALWLLRQGYKLAQVAWLIGVHIRTLNRWLSWYRKGGIKELKARHRGNPRGKKPFLTEEQLLELEKNIRSGSFANLQETIAWVRENFGVNYSYWGLYSLLRRMGLSGRGGFKAKAKKKVQMW
ncbi:MAG: helix-turn-helix domain-containing protein [Anaerolineae bacterium]|nr:helix-turn-helix domain-containing protein [Anaerolineae bacterium]MDW8101421.1 helix-turn-helix domain-containing protein [Anaerolineae bacterium]